MAKENENKPEPKLDERQKEAQRILDRVARDNEGVGTSSMARVADKVSGHFAANENPEDDQIEIMGKRIGRALSAIAVVILVIYLVNTYILN